MNVKPHSREGGDWEKVKQKQQDLAHIVYQDSDSVQDEEKITIDYMAKDYASFRNALLDLIPRKIPQWKDKSEADIGIMLIELFSYIADELSYFQDRVANEAFLRTAKARSSVSNHLSLIDYHMHNALSANAFIKFEVNEKKSAIIPAGFQISTLPQRGRVGEAAGIIIFETLQDQLVDVAYNAIYVKKINNNNSYDDVNPSAELKGRYPKLAKGQYVLFFQDDRSKEEKEDEEDKKHTLKEKRAREGEEEKSGRLKEREQRLTNLIMRQVVLVKLAEDSKIIDDDDGNNSTTLITWEKSRGSGNEYPKLAHGGNTKIFCCANILNANHGRTIRSEVLKQKDHKVSKFLFTSKEAPLTFTSASDSPIPMEARSSLKVWVNGELWEETDSLLKCAPFDQKFSISIDENGYGTILFGDGKFGLKPGDDSLIEVEYRVGNGSIGNVGDYTLTQFDLPQNSPALIKEIIESVTNPLPATGGRDMESMDDARIAGPKSLKDLERAVTLKDYEDLVMREFQNEITNAKARFVYTGSWDAVFVSVDVKGDRNRRGVYSDLFDRIRKYLNRIKMIGYDVQVEDAKYVPIEIALDVFLKRNFDSKIVRERVRSSLTSKDSKVVIAVSNRSRGLFHPDNFTFGDPVYASKIYEVLKNTSEVKYGIIRTFRRRHHDDDDNSSSTIPGKTIARSSSLSSSSSSGSVDVIINQRDEETRKNLELGYIPINENEIITIDDVPSHPENGILILNFVEDNESKTDEDNLDYDYFLSDNNSES
jgi:hypothetical protein